MFLTALAAPAYKASIFDWINNLGSEAMIAITVIAGVLAAIFVIMAGVSSQGRMGKIVVALISAGIFVWGVSNIDTLSGAVDDTVTDANEGNG